ncbi:hypothetical protein D9M71_804550 [compost metagenome]
MEPAAVGGSAAMAPAAKEEKATARAASFRLFMAVTPGSWGWVVVSVQGALYLRSDK